MALKENLLLLECMKYKAFVEIKPNTNKEYAEWILKADELGFIIYGMFGNNDKAQFLNIKEGKDIQGLSPKGPVFKGLTLIFEIVKKTIEKWIGDRMTTSKPQTSLGSFVRRTDKEGYHFSGNAIDIQLDPTHQMLKDILESLPEGEYGIGLPFKDGNDGFFPSANHLKNFDEEGVIRIGAEVSSGDILVGKITPKGETTLSAEEKLLRAIFCEKAKDVRDSSLYLEHGEHGKVVDIKIFSREDGDKL